MFFAIAVHAMQPFLANKDEYIVLRVHGILKTQYILSRIT